MTRLSTHTPNVRLLLFILIIKQVLAPNYIPQFIAACYFARKVTKPFRNFKLQQCLLDISQNFHARGPNF